MIDPRARRPRSGLPGLAVVAFAALLGLWTLLPPVPLGELAPEQRFSAARAMAHVSAVAVEPHMIGSAANARVRDYLLSELAGLGLELQTQRELVVRDHPHRPEYAPRVAWPANVVARLPGSSDLPAIALMTHYDSVPTAPGAGDAGSGVATLLETARALTASGTKPVRDILFVFTDGEEIGLMGAQVFLRAHPWAERIGLVLNFEARGAAGPAYMFQTSADNRQLIEAFARLAPHPVGNSVSGEIYRHMPNDTDATIALVRPVELLNFAFVDDFHRYHAPSDTTEHLSLRSLQHEGDNALALVRAWADAGSLPQADGDATYFNLGPGILLHYGPAGVYTAGAAAIVAAMAALIMGWRRARFRLRSLGAAALATLAALLAASWLCQGLFALAADSERPFALLYQHRTLLAGYLLLTLGLLATLWNQRAAVRRWASLIAAGAIAAMMLLTTAIGGGALVAVALLIAHGLLVRDCRPDAVTAVVTLAWTGLTIAALILLPHGAYATTWPLLGGSLALLWGWRRDRLAPIHGAWALAVPLVIWSATLYAFYLALGLSVPALVVPAVVLVAGWGAAWVTALNHRSATVLAAAGVLLVVWTRLNDPYDRHHPRPSELFYAVNADTEEAWWLSGDSTPPAWAADLFGNGSDTVPAADWLPNRSGRWFAGPAPLIDVTGSGLRPTEIASTDDGFRMRFQLVAAPRSSRVELFFPGADYTGGTLQGRELPTPRADADYWHWTLFAPPARPLELVIEGRGQPPSEVRLTDIDYGWPGFVAERVPPRPADTMAPPWRFSESVLVTRTIPIGE